MEDATPTDTGGILAHVDTLLHADSVGWCPDPAYPDLLLLATYQLDPALRLRHGGLLLLSTSTSTSPLHLLHSLPAPSGVLDVKWAYHTIPSHSAPLAATANALGEVLLWQLVPPSDTASQEEAEAEGKVRVEICGEGRAEGDGELALTVEWNSRVVPGITPHVAVGYSERGYVAEWRVEEGGSGQLLHEERRWKAHDESVWAVAYNWHEPTTLFSGSDDCTLKGWDTRLPAEKTQALFTKRGTMGVTSIQMHPRIPHCLATGSYDEYVRLWDLRMITRRQPVAEHHTGGGVWRIQWHPNNNNWMALACMHNGCLVLDWSLENAVEQDIPPPTTRVHMTQHQSANLAYGIDWALHDTTKHRLVSCSFYNHQALLWQLPGA